MVQQRIRALQIKTGTYVHASYSSFEKLLQDDELLGKLQFALAE